MIDQPPRPVRLGYRARIAVAVVVGIAVEAAIVGLGRVLIARQPDLFNCASSPPLPAPMHQPPFYAALDAVICAPTTIGRWSIVLITYCVGLFAAFVLIDSVAVRADRAPDGLFVPATTAIWTALALLPMYGLATDAGAVAVDIWVVTTLVAPVAAVGLAYGAWRPRPSDRVLA